MANDNFYGYTPKNEKHPKHDKAWSGMEKSTRKGQVTYGTYANIGNRLDRVNPYEFKKGMYYELGKLGTSLRESEEEQREKATETILKNLENVSPSYYSYMMHYETVTRNMDRKPSFKSFLKELEGHSMKEVNEKFTEDKMKEIKLKENIRAEVRNKINEIFKL